MDRALLTEYLAQAERHVKLGEEHVARQTALIARLEERGVDTAEAKRLLGEFQALLAVHIRARDRIRDELAVESEKKPAH